MEHASELYRATAFEAALNIFRRHCRHSHWLPSASLFWRENERKERVVSARLRVSSSSSFSHWRCSLGFDIGGTGELSLPFHHHHSLPPVHYLVPFSGPFRPSCLASGQQSLIVAIRICTLLLLNQLLLLTSAPLSSLSQTDVNTA